MKRTLIALLASLSIGACSASTGGGNPPGGDPVDDGKGDVGDQDPTDDPGDDPIDDPSDDPSDDPIDDPTDDPSDPGDDPFVGAEAEPNDSAEAANAISGMPASLSGALTAGDKDYFAIALDAGDAVEVETVVQAPPEGAEGVTYVDTVVEVWAPGAAEALVTNDDGGQNRGSLARFTAPAGGDWIIVVRGYRDTTTGDYTLDVRAGIPEVAPGGAESEPNDSSGQATALPALPSALTATLEAGGVDWFSFEATGAGTIVVETDVVDGEAGTDTVIEAFAADGTTSLGTDDDGAEAALCSRLALEVPAAGRYYVQVRGYGDTTAGSYVIRGAAQGGAAAE
jgi:hypothetical protein